MKHCAKTVYFVTKRICARTSVWVLAPCVHVCINVSVCARVLRARVYMYIRFISRVTASVCRVLPDVSRNFNVLRVPFPCIIRALFVCVNFFMYDLSGYELTRKCYVYKRRGQPGVQISTTYT